MSRNIKTLSNDLISVFKSFDAFTSPFELKSYTFGEVFDTDRYELVERNDYTDRKVKSIEEEIKTFERCKESSERYYNTKITSLKGEKERLLGNKYKTEKK